MDSDNSNDKGCLVDGLPTELLARIFYLGTHLVDDLYTPVPFPVLASQVCHLWRSIAVGSPSLWTSITFSRRRPHKRPPIWIERSKDLPIEITITVIFSNEGPVDEILDMIVPHVTRWRKLEVLVDREVYVENILTRLAQCDSAPLLEILSLHYSDLDSTPLTLRSISVPFHGNAPRLSYVSLTAVNIGWSSSLLRDLVEFELADHAMDVRPRWSQFSRILRESPRLTHLQLDFSGPAEPLTDWQDDSIELPSLESLSLTNSDLIYVSSLFRLLSMPNLERLTLILHGSDQSEFIRQLATPHRSVLSGLRYLKILDLSSAASVINAMYERLINLECILLNCELIHKSFFTVLMEPFSGTMFCPNLTTIITSGILGEEMRLFIAARATSGIPIKRVVMREDDASSEEDERWLRENVQSFERFYDVLQVDMDAVY